MNDAAPEQLLIDVLGEGAEMQGFICQIDSLELDEIGDVLDEIPILKTILALRKFGLGVQEILFMRKLSRFVQNLDGISESDRKRFLDDLDRDPKMKKKMSDGLFLLLSRLDDLEKPALVARAMKAHVSQRIDVKTFKRFCRAIDTCFLSDLERLVDKSCAIDIPEEEGLGLVSCGLLSPHVGRGHSMKGGGNA